MIRNMAKVNVFCLVEDFVTKENIKIIVRMAMVSFMISMVTYMKDKWTSAINTAKAN